MMNGYTKYDMPMQWNVIQLGKKSQVLIHATTWIKTSYQVKEAIRKRGQTIWSHFYEVSRMGKCRQESRVVAALGEWETQSDSWRVQGFFLKG